MGFGDVLADLAKIGYDAEWQCIPAAAVGALHKRDRVFIVAYSNSSSKTNGREREIVSSQNTKKRNDRGRGERNSGQIGVGSTRQTASVVADTDNARGRTPTSGIDADGSAKIKKRQNVAQSGVSRRSKNVANTDSKRLQRRVKQVYQTTKSTRPALCSWWQTEPDVGRVAYGVPNRVDRLRGLGNAVVPQVAELVGRLIAKHAA